jgi:hypothetical protein
MSVVPTHMDLIGDNSSFLMNRENRLVVVY